MSGAVITRETSDALDRVMTFFGIDGYNRFLFGDAARVAGVEEFSKVIAALDGAIAMDPRRGINERIRQNIAQDRAAAPEQGRGKSWR